MFENLNRLTGLSGKVVSRNCSISWGGQVPTCALLKLICLLCIWHSNRCVLSVQFQIATSFPNVYLPHRNNRHRMRAPIFSQSKIYLHKMARSKGHFYSGQTPVARNFARLREVRLFFFKHNIFKKFKNEIKLKNTLSKEDIFVKNSS